MFDCKNCKLATQAKRRCRDDREDFTDSDDSSVFPIYVEKGGELYSFCPGKATWDVEIVNLFQLLMLCSETGTMLYSGGVADQPDWFVEFMTWFMPRYQNTKFYLRAKSLMGDGRKLLQGVKGSGNNTR